MKAGRPKKSALGNKPWDARLCAQALREALEIVRNKIERFDQNLDPNLPNPDLTPKGRAACTLGVLLLDCCDPDNPWEFLRIIADEGEGKLMHSPRDEQIWRAYMRMERNKWSEFRKRYETLIGRKLDNDKDHGILSSLRRSFERLIGYRLYEKSRNRNGSKSVPDKRQKRVRRSGRRTG